MCPLAAGLAAASCLLAAGFARTPAARPAYLASVRQAGPVAYRDPLGVVSPDGQWLATASTLQVSVRRLSGGPVRRLGDGSHRIAALAWLPDSSYLAVRRQDFERTSAEWLVFDVRSGASAPLWPGRSWRTVAGEPVPQTALLELAWRPPWSGGSADAGAERRAADAGGEARIVGNEVAAAVAAVVQVADSRRELWLLSREGGVVSRHRPDAWLSRPAWRPDGRVACLVGGRRASRLAEDCTAGRALAGPAAFGPVAGCPDGSLWYGAPEADGVLGLWRRDAAGHSRRVLAWERDTYAPSCAADGTVVFENQEYRATIALLELRDGSTRAVTSFQAETPSWHPDGRRIGFTWGNWRHATDDAGYPDIAQNLGLVELDSPLPASAPSTIVRRSGSEDQGLHFSPDGRWIALHSHADGSDDVWLQPADGSVAARRISSGGSETGWPRFSPDGRWIVYPTDEPGPGPRRLGLLMRIGFDPATGRVRVPAHELPLPGFDGQVSFAEWTPDGRQIVFEALHGPRRRAIWIVAADGGRPRLLHEFVSAQWFSGLSVSPADATIVFVAPDAGGYFQLWAMPIEGGRARALTDDPSDKTQPSFAPDGGRVAYTTFTYRGHFYRVR